MNSIALLLLTSNHLWCHCLAGRGMERSREAQAADQSLNQSQPLQSGYMQTFKSRFAAALSTIIDAIKLKKNQYRYVEPTKEQLAEYDKLVKEYKEALKKLDIGCGQLHDQYYRELERARYQLTDGKVTQTLWYDYITCREQYEKEVDIAADKMEAHFVHSLVERGFYKGARTTSSSTDSRSSETY
ncbi:hypothetical protein D918_04344 [Trichuris suis]|nr:hypothetical protein D918_04344 [Trichuris suis]